jgi:hypothetical protein
MKYVRPFQSFKRNRNKSEYSLNEEIFPTIVNFFKNLWQKVSAEMKKALGDNPSIDKIEDYVDKNPMNPQDDAYIFKSVIEEFNKKPEANEQDCLDLIKNILDPQLGSLGKQGLQPLYDNLLKTFGNQTATLDIIKYIFERIRNRAIKDYKYAGGPDLKIDPKVEARVDDKKIILDMKDTTHLPDFKKVILAAQQDNKKRKQLALDWVNKTLVPRLDKYLTEITNEEIEKYLELAGKEAPEAGPEGGYKVGDTVIYKRDKFVEDEWKKITDDEKLKPNEGKMKELQDKEMIGIKKIKEIRGEDVSFEDADFTKKMADLLGKVDAKAEGQEDLVKKLGELKTKKPDDIKKVTDFVDFISDEKNRDKVDDIYQIMKPADGGK